MPWKQLILNSTVDLCDGATVSFDEDDTLAFTTADLRWQPLVSSEPEGAQIAMLWGDPAECSFGAVMHLPKHPPGVYTLIRRTTTEARPRSRGARGHS